MIDKVYEQQKYMYEHKVHSVPNRIVSISQPYIRPIVRGKAAAPVEFGAKMDLSLDEKGMARIEKMSFDAYNESDVLIAAGTDGVVAGSDGAESESVPLELKPEIVYDDFAKIDFRVGIIEKAEKHPKADKLLVFQVKMGTERRQVISGVAEDFTPEEMVGKKVIVVANLKPRQLRGMESKGMLLFADNGKRCEIVTTTAPDGEVVS